MKSSTFCYTLTAALILTGLPSLPAAEYPAWWLSNSVVDTSASVTNDYAAANQGQVKWIAEKAKGHLDTYLSGGSGLAVAAIVNSFSSSNNYFAVNLGQLKHVAKPFYDRLIAESYTNSYPWTTNVADDVDYAIAAAGQVKYVFSFDLDTDNDGMSDLWEQTIVDDDPEDEIESIEDVLPGDDYDEDGFTNLQEFQNGTDPIDPDNSGPTLVIVWPTNAARRVWIP